ncbi:MAG: YbaB/EbfC family nucleoid-associated protein [Thermodesulfobacteriota bacterium]
MDMQEMMKQAQEMQKKMSQMQQELANQTVEATSGGGMVSATATGSLELTDLKIDPSVVDSDDVAMLQDLVLAATNEAIKKAREMMENEMSKITGGMNIPGMGLT